MTILLDGNDLTLEQLEAVALHRESIALSPSALQRIQTCRLWLEGKMHSGQVVYGLNTGIGEFAEIRLSDDQLEAFQRYMIYSHAVGVGDPLPEEAVRAAILSRINCHCQGRSGQQPLVTTMLVELLNRAVTPVVPSRGSVSACGDLAPMAHIALVLLGEGEAFFQGQRLPGSQALQRAGLAPIQLQARDGLATINGANVVTGIGALQIKDAERWLQSSEIAVAMTLEALNAQMQAYDLRLVDVRPFAGVRRSMKAIRDLTEGSSLLDREGKRVQDAYSLRSTPQVIGAAWDTLEWARSQILTELNGVGDNPVFFPEEDAILTGANFQGTYVSFSLDFLATALTTVSVISERRINRLVNPYLNNGLPPFLSPLPGLFTGMMITQYTADALVCEQRVLSTPASIGSIPAAADQEDFVSMGMIAAHKLRQILDNAWDILAIELLCAAQAIDLLHPLTPGRGTTAAYRCIRSAVAKLDEDRPLSPDIRAIAKLARQGDLIRAVASASNIL